MNCNAIVMNGLLATSLSSVSWLLVSSGLHKYTLLREGEREREREGGRERERGAGRENDYSLKNRFIELVE